MVDCFLWNRSLRAVLIELCKIIRSTARGWAKVSTYGFNLLDERIGGYEEECFACRDVGFWNLPLCMVEAQTLSIFAQLDTDMIHG